MQKTSSGSFGSRYGKRIREEVVLAQKKSSAKYHCPSCSRQSVRRVSTAVWQCTHCDKKFAGSAYEFRGLKV